MVHSPDRNAITNRDARKRLSNLDERRQSKLLFVRMCPFILSPCSHGQIVGFISAVASQCRWEGLLVRNVQGVGSGLGRHGLRFAVKDRDSNRRMLAILSRVLAPGGPLQR